MPNIVNKANAQVKNKKAAHSVNMCHKGVDTWLQHKAKFGNLFVPGVV